MQSQIQGTRTDALTPITAVIKKSLEQWTRSSAQHMMKKHLQQLRLLDKNEKWASPLLAGLGDRILPSSVSREEAEAFVERIAQVARQNPYLMDFLTQATQRSFPELESRVKAEGDRLFPDVIAYAIILENLTREMRNDWRVLEDCQKIWKEERAKAHIERHMDLFDFAKLASIENSVDNFLKFHRERAVPGNYFRVMLPVNILEAVGVDITLGNLGNAQTGRVLATYGVGHDVFDARTGAGPTHFSQDGKSVNMAMAFPKEWADLYGTWNLAFVSHYGNFPYVMTKLLIPQVAEYQNSPEDYLYNRILALYTQLHYSYIGRAESSPNTSKFWFWNTKELSNFWGEVNQRSASSYETLVKQAQDR